MNVSSAKSYTASHKPEELFAVHKLLLQKPGIDLNLQDEVSSFIVNLSMTMTILILSVVSLGRSDGVTYCYEGRVTVLCGDITRSRG